MKIITLLCILVLCSVGRGQSSLDIEKIDWLSKLLQERGVKVGYVRFFETSSSPHVKEAGENKTANSKEQSLLEKKEFMSAVFRSKDDLTRFAKETCALHGYTFSFDNGVAHLLPSRGGESDFMSRKFRRPTIADSNFNDVLNELSKRTGHIFMSMADYAKKFGLQKVTVPLPDNLTAIEALDAAIASAKLSGWTSDLWIDPFSGSQSNKQPANIVVVQFERAEIDIESYKDDLRSRTR